jgi:hypothetical protein
MTDYLLWRNRPDQPPDRPRSSVFLLVTNYLTDEKGKLEAIAASQDLQLIQKYASTPDLNIGKFEGVDFGNCANHLLRVLS